MSYLSVDTYSPYLLWYSCLCSGSRKFMCIRLQLLIFMFVRLVLNTMHRMVYPFLAVFARGLGVEITTLSFVVTARSFVGIFAPVFGPFVDRRGRKFGLL